MNIEDDTKKMLDEKAAQATHVIENNGTPEDLEKKLADLVAEVTVRKSL